MPIGLSFLYLLAFAGGVLSGTVTGSDGNPVAGAIVKVTGQNITLSRPTNVSGRFAFSTLGAGQYTVEADKGTLHASQVVELTDAGSDIVLALSSLRTIGDVAVSRSPFAAKSGTDVTLTSMQLVRTPAARSLPDVLAQLPAAARGSNGQIHVNGDHNGLNYIIDGVQLPASLNRVLGNEIDPSEIGFLDAIEGAYPAQYGDRFAAVLNIGTRVYGGAPGIRAEADSGSFATTDSTFGYHAAFGAGSLSFSARFGRNERGIDPPVRRFTHDAASDASQFLRYSVPLRGSDTLNLDVMHSVQSFRIPPDTRNGVPAATDDDEFQNDLFASLQYRHDIGGHGSISFGPSFKRSHILDTNDLTNDLAAGEECTDFSDCSFYSVFADRTAVDLRFTADYDLRSARHDVRSGVLLGTTAVDKRYVIALAPFTKIDTAPNIAHQQETYAQDTWRMGNGYQLDYGVRADAFQIGSAEFHNGFSQISPRIKLSRAFSPRSGVYAYYGRLFVPFSFENVSPSVAASLFVPANRPASGFDLRPQRDSLYEIGGHAPLGHGDVGVRISHKVSSDYIDDTQVGATNLHQDINFPQARIDIQSVYFRQPLSGNGRFSFSIAHGSAVTSTNCETQLLQNCAAGGPPGGPFVPADHDQRWSANAGLLRNDSRGGWFAANAEYGSGLTGAPAPHLTFDAEKGFALGPKLSAAVVVKNVFNDTYAITLDSSLQGTHYAQPRYIGLRLSLSP